MKPDPTNPNAYRLAHHVGMQAVILGLSLDGAMQSPASQAIARGVLEKSMRAIEAECPAIGARYRKLLQDPSWLDELPKEAEK